MNKAGASYVQDQSILAHDLHARIQNELRRGGYDSYQLKADPYNVNSEPLKKPVVNVVKSDEYNRQFLKGPSCVREKFTSKYWRVWNVEKNLLEDLSLDELGKEMVYPLYP